jgi:hypoxanthine phosphoribosyltransferase
MDVFNIISLAIGVAGLFGTLYFGLKSVYLQRKIRRFEWEDVEVGVRHLNNEISSRFNPELILTISAPGAIVANLFVTHRSKITPVYVGITLHKEDSRSLSFTTDHHIITTSKWRIAVPNALLRHKDKRLLVLDGSVITGDAMSNLLKLLTENGFDRNYVLTASLITTDVALRAGKGPDIYWHNVPDCEIYMPWGHLIGPGY